MVDCEEKSKLLHGTNFDRTRLEEEVLENWNIHVVTTDNYEINSNFIIAFH